MWNRNYQSRMHFKRQGICIWVVLSVWTRIPPILTMIGVVWISWFVKNCNFGHHLKSICLFWLCYRSTNVWIRVVDTIQARRNNWYLINHPAFATITTLASLTDILYTTDHNHSQMIVYKLIGLIGCGVARHVCKVMTWIGRRVRNLEMMPR